MDELNAVVHSSRAKTMGKRMCEKLKEMIPRQMIQIAIQAAIGGKIVARETLKAFRKDVTAKLVSDCSTMYHSVPNYELYIHNFCCLKKK